MPSKHSEIVAARFGARARQYEQHAGLQAEIAMQLAAMLPDAASPAILEVGCGTGLLTGHLLKRYPDASILATDLVPEMVRECQSNHGNSAGQRLRCAVMDGENASCDETFDLVVSSMTLQWFADPVKGLQFLARQLREGGQLRYATIAPDCFPEWRKVLGMHGLAEGLIEMPELPGVCREETRVIDYGSGAAFLKALKLIGAGTPRPGYRPLTPGGLRRALKVLEDDCAGRITWRIVYGCLSTGDANVA